MTTASWNKFKDAIDSVGIKKFQIDSDTDYHLFNDPDASKVIVFDEGTETFYNFRQRVGNGSDGWSDPVVVTAVEVQDIHMIKFGADVPTINKFIEAKLAVPITKLKMIILFITNAPFAFFIIN